MSNVLESVFALVVICALVLVGFTGLAQVAGVNIQQLIQEDSQPAAPMPTTISAMQAEDSVAAINEAIWDREAAESHAVVKHGADALAVRSTIDNCGSDKFRLRISTSNIIDFCQMDSGGLGVEKWKRVGGTDEVNGVWHEVTAYTRSGDTIDNITALAIKYGWKILFPLAPEMVDKMVAEGYKIYKYIDAANVMTYWWTTK